MEDNIQGVCCKFVISRGVLGNRGDRDCFKMVAFKACERVIQVIKEYKKETVQWRL